MEPVLVDGIISGRVAARVVRAEVKAEVELLRAKGIHPRLVFVRVGDDPASEVYVGAKEKACGWVGIESSLIHLSADTREAALAKVVEDLNRDDSVDGILVQMPLPEAIQSKQVLNLIEPYKDVDGFHPRNLGALLAGSGPLEPCTPAGIMRLIRLLGVHTTGKHAVVVGRSPIVGRPMTNIFMRSNATVTCCHRHTKDLEEHVRRADLLVVATGVPHLVPGEWIKEGAYVFDVGITRLKNGQLRGDVVFEEARKRAAGITPVPGGIGPMTIAQLLVNTVKVAKLRRGILEQAIQRA